MEKIGEILGAKRNRKKLLTVSVMSSANWPTCGNKSPKAKKMISSNHRIWSWKTTNKKTPVKTTPCKPAIPPCTIAVTRIAISPPCLLIRRSNLWQRATRSTITWMHWNCLLFWLSRLARKKKRDFGSNWSFFCSGSTTYKGRKFKGSLKSIPSKLLSTFQTPTSRLRKWSTTWNWPLASSSWTVSPRKTRKYTKNWTKPIRKKCRTTATISVLRRSAA